MTPPAIAYFAHELAPGRYFVCPYGYGTLSDSACARLYQDAMSPAGLREGRRITCRGCPVGAVHAGVHGIASASRFLGATWCARCHHDARRLIRGALCVSCYNREREVLIGKNAKGSKPIFGKQVSPVILSCYSENGKKSVVLRMEKVSSRLEAVLSVLRRDASAVSFGWIGAAVCRDAML